MDRSVAVYSEVFLTRSMTFVYRELGSEGLRKLACTKRVANRALFPFDPVISLGVARLLESGALNRIYRLLGREFVHCSRSELAFWVKRLGQYRVGLIHAHFGPAGLTMLPVTRALGVPLLTTFHGSDLSRLLGNRVYVLQLQRLLREGDRHLTVSDHFRQRLLSLGCPADRVQTHYLGVPVERYRFRKRILDPARVRLVQVANLVAKKGHSCLLDAFRHLLAIHRDVELLLVGDGPMRPEIEEKIRRLGLSGRVTLLGGLPSESALEVMDGCDIFVQPSETGPNGDTEGIPTAIMEAMSLGLPVVSTHHAGIPELISDGVNGLLGPERDSEAIADRIAALIEEPALYSRISVEGRRTIEERFNLHNQRARLEEIYLELIGRGRTG